MRLHPLSAILHGVSHVGVGRVVASARNLLESGSVKVVVRSEVVRLLHLRGIELAAVVPVALHHGARHPLKKVILVRPAVVAVYPRPRAKLLHCLNEPKEIVPPKLALTYHAVVVVALPSSCATTRVHATSATVAAKHLTCMFTSTP